MTDRNDKKFWELEKYEKISIGPSCHESHPEVSLGGGVVFGGNCKSPREGFDAYVALDYSATMPASCYPWREKPAAFVHYLIDDRQPPKTLAEFRSLVAWLCNRLQKGERVFIGCMGGHGRTGLLIAAIAAKLGEKDPIAWVRKHHCKKAVESRAQVQFLVDKFGAAQAKATDTWPLKTEKSGSKTHGSWSGKSGWSGPGLKALASEDYGVAPDVETVLPVSGAFGALWK